MLLARVNPFEKQKYIHSSNPKRKRLLVEGTKAKDEAIDDWCSRITEEIGQPWKYVRIDQILFDGLKPKSLLEVINAKYEGGGLFS
jgi:hypothetical protein